MQVYKTSHMRIFCVHEEVKYIHFFIVCLSILLSEYIILGMLYITILSTLHIYTRSRYIKCLDIKTNYYQY